MNLTKEQPPAKYMLEMNQTELQTLSYELEMLQTVGRESRQAITRLRNLLRESAGTDHAWWKA